MSSEGSALGLVGFNPAQNISPDFKFAAFVEDFVAHFGVEFARDVGVAAGAHKIDCLCEILMADNTRVVSASDEEDWCGRIFHLPTFWVISTFHQAEKDDEAIQREGEAVAFISVIGGDHGRVANYPSIGTSIVGGIKVIIRFGELRGKFIIAAKSKVIDEFAAMTLSAEEFHKFSNGNGGTGTDVFAR